MSFTAISHKSGVSRFIRLVPPRSDYDREPSGPGGIGGDGNIVRDDSPVLGRTGQGAWGGTRG